MNYRTICACCLALCLIFAGAGFIQAQTAAGDKKDDAAKKDDAKKDDATKQDDTAKDDAKKDEDKKEADKPLTKKEFDELMEDHIEDAWNKLKINARKKMADRAAESADTIAELAPKILRYDGKVLKGDDKGKKAAEQKDFKKWAAELQQNAEDYSKYAKKGDWDKADKAKEKISDTCSACHDMYEPEDEK